MKTKKEILFSAIVILMALVATSCNKWFSTLPPDVLTEDQLWQNVDYTEGFLANVYSYLPDENNQRFATGNQAGTWTSGCSEADYVWKRINGGSYDAGGAAAELTSGQMTSSSNQVQQYWTAYWRAISKATTFIQNVDQCPTAQLAAQLKIWRRGEAIALRAFYYWQLFKIYGPIPIMGDDVFAPDASAASMMLPRCSVDSCVSFITNQFDAAASLLPDMPATSGDQGRMTAAIVEALKCQVLLFAASPLYNGDPDFAKLADSDGTKLFPQSADPNKWKVARAAYDQWFAKYGQYFSLLTLDHNGSKLSPGVKTNFDPYLSCREVVRGNDFSNPEAIFIRTNTGSGTMQYDRTPRFGGGVPDGSSYPSQIKQAGGQGELQEMVDMFFTSQGIPIDAPGSNYFDFTTGPVNPTFFVGNGAIAPSQNYTDPWYPTRIFAPANGMVLKSFANREPRFYVNVIFHGMDWGTQNSSAKGCYPTFDLAGNSGPSQGLNDCPIPGYVVGKGSLVQQNTGGYYYTFIRLGGMYLDYAEICNECGDISTAIQYVNYIRNRAGVPEYGTGTDSNGLTRISYPNNIDDVRNRIWRERTIELAFENQRYFDLRRWKVMLGESLKGSEPNIGWLYPLYHQGGENGAMHGLNIQASQTPASGYQFFTRIVCENYSFSLKDYFYPIPYNECNIDPNLAQNLGW